MHGIGRAHAHGRRYRESESGVICACTSQGRQGKRTCCLLLSLAPCSQGDREKSAGSLNLDESVDFSVLRNTQNLQTAYGESGETGDFSATFSREAVTGY